MSLLPPGLNSSGEWTVPYEHMAKSRPRKLLRSDTRRIVDFAAVVLVSQPAPAQPLVISVFDDIGVDIAVDPNPVAQVLAVAVFDAVVLCDVEPLDASRFDAIIVSSDGWAQLLPESEVYALGNLPVAQGSRMVTITHNLNNSAAVLTSAYGVKAAPGWFPKVGVLAKTANTIVIGFDIPAPVGASLDWRVQDA